MGQNQALSAYLFDKNWYPFESDSSGILESWKYIHLHVTGLMVVYKYS